MNEYRKWWLISDDDVATTRKSLSSYEHEANDFNCPDPGDPVVYDGLLGCFLYLPWAWRLQSNGTSYTTTRSQGRYA